MPIPINTLTPGNHLSFDCARVRPGLRVRFRHDPYYVHSDWFGLGGVLADPPKVTQVGGSRYLRLIPDRNLREVLDPYTRRDLARDGYLLVQDIQLEVVLDDD